MAYYGRTTNRDSWAGPHPDRAGEWCGNIKPGEKSWNHVYTGRPAAKTKQESDRLFDLGHRGLYLIQDHSNLEANDTRWPLDTDVLTEEVVSGIRPARKLPTPISEIPR